jgi:hypothetical protein
MDNTNSPGALWTGPEDAAGGYNGSSSAPQQEAKLGFSPGRAAEDSAASSQQSLITRVSPDPFSATTASDATSAQLLQRLYGSIGQFNHGSRASLPDILEEAEAGAAVLASAAAHHAHGARSLSDEDLFQMDVQQGAALAQQQQQQQQAAAQPDPLMGGHVPFDGASSRTLFVRGVDPGVTDESLQEFFEVRSVGSTASPWSRLSLSAVSS